MESFFSPLDGRGRKASREEMISTQFVGEEDAEEEDAGEVRIRRDPRCRFTPDADRPGTAAQPP